MLLAIADRVEQNANLLERLESVERRQAERRLPRRRLQHRRHLPVHGRSRPLHHLPGRRRLHRRSPVGDHPRTARRHRRGHAVELSAADGGLEAGADPGRRQHRGAEAVGADPADHAEVRRTRRRPAARRGAEHRHRLRPRGRRPTVHPSRPRHDRLDRLGGQRPRRGQGGGRVAEAGPPRARRQGTGRWSSPTPTWPPRRRRCAPPATGTPARSAAPAAGCSCTPRSPTSSSTTWSARCPPWSSASPAPATTSRSGRWCPRPTSTGSPASWSGPPPPASRPPSAARRSTAPATSSRRPC